MSGKIKVTQKKSTAGQLKNIRACVRGLGLRRIGHTVEVIDTAPNRGMIRHASHLVVVEKA
ncbi:MAG: 50S ribosomal protein L30 [Pseudomonadota bacterium]|jgi:large subunit ribosomal protein L30